MPTYNPCRVYFIIFDTSTSCQQNLKQGSEAAQLVEKFLGSQSGRDKGHSSFVSLEQAEKAVNATLPTQNCQNTKKIKLYLFYRTSRLDNEHEL